MRAFYLDAEQWKERPILEGQEVAHMHVLRMQAGEKIQLFDGRGKVAVCSIVKLGRKNAELEIESEELFPRPESRPILALALSKAVRRGFFMEKAVELGAFEIWLWQADHSQGKLVSSLAVACEHQLVAGLKQCKNPWLPALHVLKDAASVVGRGRQISRKIMPWEERAGTPPIGLAELGNPGDTLYVIGPEGGFSAQEAALFLDNDFLAASLGERVLRCETAATFCLALHGWASQVKKFYHDQLATV